MKSMKMIAISGDLRGEIPIQEYWGRGHPPPWKIEGTFTPPSAGFEPQEEIAGSF